MKLSGQTIEEMIPESEESDEEFLAFTKPGLRKKTSTRHQMKMKT